MIEITSIAVLLVCLFLNAKQKQVDRFTVEGSSFENEIRDLSACTLMGKRKYQEDRLLMDVFGQGRYIVVAVLDGHGFNTCAEFLKQNLTRVLAESLSTDLEPNADHTNEIRQACMSLHQLWLARQKDSTDLDMSGSTLTGMVLDHLQPNKCWTMNLGDSQTILYGKKSRQLRVTNNHDLSPERITQVKTLDPWATIVKDNYNVTRLAGYATSLNLSGAYGNSHDIKLYKSLLKQVEVTALDLTEETLVIVGSDGLEDFTPSQLVDFVQKQGMNAEKLAHFVDQNGSKGDNISCIVFTLSPLPIKI